jgi:hypothetical protein
MCRDIPEMDLNMWRICAFTLAVTLTAVTGQSCTWGSQPNSNTPNGALQSSISDLTTCKAQCQAAMATTCPNGFDWDNSAQKCYFSTSTSVNVNGSPNVDHYVCSISSTIGNSGGSGASTQASSTVCTYNETANSNSPGGAPQSGKNDQLSCKQACDANSRSCAYGFDFNPTGPTDQRCWFSASTVVNTGTFPGCTHYTRWCFIAPVTTTGYMSSGMLYINATHK